MMPDNRQHDSLGATVDRLWQRNKEIWRLRKALEEIKSAPNKRRAYAIAKAYHIRKVASQQTDSRVKAGLLHHATLYEHRLIQ